MIYRWKEGARMAADAAKVGPELERIRIRHNGRLEPDWVVHEAKAEASPLHPLFEWNDTIAAQNYRVDQARGVIRSIEVVIEDRPEQKPVRAFVSVVRENDRTYTSVQDAMSDPKLREQVLRAALAELEAWRRRYAELVELANVFAAIDEARAA